MNEKSTGELKNILRQTHPDQFEDFCRENSASLIHESNSFFVFIRDIIQRNGMTQQRVFIEADIPERYGYKLLSGEKHTKQRDVILRLCYASRMTLEETQQALKKYEMPELYPKIPRDALIMILFNSRPGSVIELNSVLKEHKLEPLRNSGYQD